MVEALESRTLLAAPVIVVPTGSVAYMEGGAPAEVGGALTITDDDSSELAGASVAITGNFRSEDVLSLPMPPTGITPDYDPDTGVLVLSGNASIAIYQTALRNVVFSTGDDPGAMVRAVTFLATDAEDETSTAVTRTVTVTPVNDAPAATPQTVDVYADRSVLITLRGTDLDNDPATLDFRITTLPTQGKLYRGNSTAGGG